MRVLSSLFSYSRFGLRRFRLEPLHTLAVVLIIAVSAGANVATIGLIKAVMYRPLHVTQSEQLYRVYREDPRTHQLLEISYPQYLEMEGSTAAPVIAWASFRTGAVVEMSPEVVNGQVVSRNYFEGLGIRPLVGPGFPDPALQAAQTPAVLISHAFWTTRFEGRSAAVGAIITLNAKPFQVLGVLPKHFRGLSRLSPADIWVGIESLEYAGFPDLPSRLEQAGWLQAACRIELTTHVSQVAQRFTAAVGTGPDAQPGTRDDAGSVVLFPVDDVIVHPRVDRRWHQLAVVCLVVSALVVVVACANLAGAALSRTSSRRKEIAIRRALGASRVRIAGMLFTETAILAALGGASGLLMGLWAARVLAVQVSTIVPFGRDMDVVVPLDAGAILIVVGVCGVTCLICSLLPTVSIGKRVRPSETSASLARWHPTGTLNALIVPQVAVSLLLLFLAGVFVAAAKRDAGSQVEYSRTNGAFVTFDLSLHGYDEARGRGFLEAALESARTIPGVEFAGISDWPSPREHNRRAGVRANGRTSGPVMLARVFAIQAGLFESAGVRLLKGRYLRSDDIGRAVLLVDASTARLLWRDRNPLGQTIRVEFGDIVGGPGRLFEVIGVVGDVRDMATDGRARARLYVDWRQQYTPRANLYAVGAPPDVLVQQLRTSIQALDPQVTILDGLSLAEYARRMDSTSTLAGALLTVFGLFGLTIAAIGIGSVIEQGVQRRTREIGVRFALGATRVNIARTLLGRSAIMLMAGLGLGVAMSAAATPVVSSYLGDVSELAMPVLLSLSCMIMLVGLGTCALPLHRVLTTNVSTALNRE